MSKTGKKSSVKVTRAEMKNKRIMLFGAKIGDESATTALVLFDDSGDAFLWDIFTVPEKRGRGCGSCVLDSIKNSFNRVYSPVRTEEGRKLLTKNGFEKTFVRGVETYAWEGQKK